MEEIGQPRRTLVAALAVASFVAAAGSSWLASPFAIDDAFISIRYARHLADGAGYVWNVGGPSTDGVTPLPWAFLLEPMAGASPVVVLGRAKLAGALVWTLTATFWGGAIGRIEAPTWSKVFAVALLAANVPVMAHSASGMETSFAMALATLAALQDKRPRLAALFAGLAASLRPELVVWSVTLAAGFVWASHAYVTPSDGDAIARDRSVSRARPMFGAAFVAALPFVLCAAARLVAFGRPAPLSVIAKPSDFAHGLAYAGAAAVLSLAPLVLMAPVAIARERGPAAVLVLAALAHFAVIIAVGGDWMPYARLVAPIVPAMLVAFVRLAPSGRLSCHLLRATAAVGCALWLTPGSVRTLRRAGEERARMIEVARPLLASAKRIAALDIGWVSAISEATIIDLAGVTDPEVAVLGGGHTSKRITPAFLLANAPDVAVFYADPLPSSPDAVDVDAFPRVVEARLVRAELFATHFAPTALLPLGERGAGYVIYSKR